MKKKRILAGILSAILSISIVGCAGGAKESAGYKTNGSELALWYEASTVKIKQSDDGEAMKAAKDRKVLKISMARNEAEGVQMFLYAKKDIESYNVTVSDLVSEDGIIPASEIDVYQVKYQEISGNGSYSNPYFREGMLPDPLLPFEKAVEYEENMIAKGNNQSIYLDVETQEGTPAGFYQGVVTVKTEKDTYQMPLEVTVYDVTYHETPGIKTAFSWFSRDHFASAELDATDEQMTAYFETLLDYNMSSALPYEGVGGIETYLELLRKYYDYDGFNSYRLYYDTAGSGYKEEATRYGAELLREYIIAIAEISVEDKKDYLDKAYFYPYTVTDEPETEEDFLFAKNVVDTFQRVLTDADTAVRQKYAGTAGYDYYDKYVSESVLNIPYFLPGYYDMEDVSKYGIEDVTLVMLTEHLHTESDREYFTKGREDKELWAYSCTGPLYPYATGHIDDYSVGFRLTSWMAYDYNWEGYLYWGTVDYLYREYGHVISDPWLVMDTGQRRPGEGRFFYPGEKYGLDNPCPSLRAMAYRDGTEDYELLATVQNIYDEYGMDARAALQSIYDSVYTGVIPTTDSYVFEDAKNELFDMVESLKSDVGVLYQEKTVDFAQAQFTFRCVNEKAKVTVDGKELKKNEEGFYEVVVDLRKQSTYAFTVTCGEESKEYEFVLLDGKLASVNEFETVGDISKYIFSTSKGYEATANKDKAFAKGGEGSVHLQINKNKEDTLPYFAIAKDSELIGGSWENMKSLQFYLYNAGTEEISVNATCYTTEETPVATYVLPAGQWTLIDLDIPVDIEDVSSIEEFDFNFQKGSKVELYLDNFATIMKGE